MGPRKTSKATIHLNFTREEPTTGTKIQPIASIDAVALEDGAIRVIRSRATASAVVARLGLDKDPDFAPEATLWRVLSDVRGAPGLGGKTPAPRALSVYQLPRRDTGTNDPPSPFISVPTYTGSTR